MKRSLLLVIFLFFFSFSYLPAASAIGIAPAKITMDFVPGYEDEFEGAISNTGETPMQFDLYASGELEKYITILSEETVTIGADDIARYRFRISLPESFERPGKHKGYIWASEHIEVPEESSGAVAVKLKVGTTVIVNVPYPGKYLTIDDFQIENPEANEDVEFMITVTNRGKENLSSVEGVMDIKDLSNNVVGSLTTESVPLDSTDSRTFRLDWFSDVNPGTYGADIRFDYDGKNTTMFKNFRLGAPLIKITNVSAGPIKNGSIGKVITEVESYWNQDIDDVYVEIRMEDESGEGVAYDKSETAIVKRFKKMEITNYWDTSEGPGPGKYNGMAILNYLDQNDTMTFTAEIKKEPGLLDGMGLLLVVAVVLACIAVAVPLAMLLRKRKGGKQSHLGSF